MAALRTLRIQPLDEPANVVAAAKIDGGIGFLKCQQAGVRGSRLVPNKSTSAAYREIGQLLQQALQASFTILHEVQMLDGRRDIGFTLRRFHHRNNFLAQRRACAYSTKHHLLLNEFFVMIAITASQAEISRYSVRSQSVPAAMPFFSSKSRKNEMSP